jgi:anaerobic ribonucleoside-triphosphate reductase activating protein
MRADWRINVARWVARSRVNGPGERFVLWVQGCTLRCAGCWNRDTWSPAPRRMMTVDELLHEIDAATGIEGVTLTGGEPFEQAEALLPLVDAIRDRGLSVMVFTGREPEEMVDAASVALVARMDVLVTGRYVAARRSLDLAWRGSSNQRVQFLTTRYGERDLPEEREAEVHLAPDGTITITGFPEASLLAG